MAVEYESPVQAQAKGSFCNFQLEWSFSLPIPTISIPIPDFSLDLDFDLFCPLD